MIINPSLYQKLINEFNGKILPPEEGMVNHLKNVYKFIPTSAVKAAKMFFENIRYVGIIDANKRLRYITPTETASEETKEENTHQASPNIEDKKNQIDTKLNTATDQLLKFEIPLSEGVKASFCISQKIKTKRCKNNCKRFKFYCKFYD